MRAALDRWIFDSFDVRARGLALYRIAFALFAFLFVAPGHGQYGNFAFIASFPDAFFLPPPGPLALFEGFPPGYAFEALHLLVNLSLAALLFGWRTRFASVLTALLLLAGYGFSYSFGKINHNLLFVLVPLVMAPSGWGAALSLDARAGRSAGRVLRSWPLVMLALLLGFAMFTAGFAKLIGGWLDPSTHATQGHLVKQFFVRGRQDLLAPFFLSVDQPLFWEALDWATVLFEVGFLAAVFHPRATRLFAALAVFFHLGTMLMLNIAFTFHLIVYAAFIDWRRAAARLPRLPSPNAQSWGLLLMLATGLLFYGVGSPLLALTDPGTFASDLTVKDLLAVGGAALLVMFFTASEGRRALIRALCSLRAARR